MITSETHTGLVYTSSLLLTTHNVRDDNQRRLQHRLCFFHDTKALIQPCNHSTMATSTTPTNNNANGNGTSLSSDFQTHPSITTTLMDQYDGFILDQFGVLHNGQYGLEGAPACVQQLKAHGKRLVILSNSSSSAQACKSKLPSLGYDPNDFVSAVTSGQEAGAFVKGTYFDDASSSSTKTTKKVLFMTWKTPKTPSPVQFLELCGIDPTRQVTLDPSEADLILCHGVDVLRGPGDAEDSEANEQSLGNFLEDGNLSEVIDPILQECLKRQLPMICANPDLIMVKPDGSIGHMPGKIAERYVELGGKCRSFGKPHREHFEACLTALDLPHSKVVHVGDSLHHDVAGANATGIDSIFVTGGIHRHELGAPLGTLPDDTSLSNLFAKEGQTPTHVIPMFRM